MSKVEVRVTEGKLIGIVEKSIHGDHYIAFRGIPYAKPPMGELRFQVSTELLLALFYFKMQFNCSFSEYKLERNKEPVREHVIKIIKLIIVYRVIIIYVEIDG